MLTAKPFQHAALLALALAASACTYRASSIPIASPGVRVRPEVARGYAAYEASLSAWGTWGPDREYGVHWCPSRDAVGDAPFHPYVSRGRWDVADAPTAGAPAGTPVWQSEDPDTWGEITTHHGWWIRPAGRPGNTWCWIPGVEETPGRVAWREGDGFVGWAPEPPDVIALADEVDYDDWFDWAYTLLGTLTSDHPDQNTLSGDARDRARSATMPGRNANGSFQRQTVGPTGHSITAAREALDQYVARHPDAIAASVARHPALASGASGSGKSKPSSSSSRKSSSTGEKDGVTAGIAPAPAPYAMAYYDAMMMEPPVGGAGLVPQMRGAAGAGTGSGAGAAVGGGRGSAGGASGDSAHARASHGVADAIHAPTPAGHPAAASSGGSSGHASSSRSSGKSSKSSRSGRSRR